MNMKNYELSDDMLDNVAGGFDPLSDQNAIFEIGDEVYLLDEEKQILCKITEVIKNDSTIPKNWTYKLEWLEKKPGYQDWIAYPAKVLRKR